MGKNWIRLRGTPQIQSTKTFETVQKESKNKKKLETVPKNDSELLNT
jgi:hypothetical protein